MKQRTEQALRPVFARQIFVRLHFQQPALGSLEFKSQAAAAIE
jgi:hypothetical protein